MVGEDLVEEDPAALGHPEAVVELVDELSDPPEGTLGLFVAALGPRGGVAHVLRSQYPGPTGWLYGPLAVRYPSSL